MGFTPLVKTVREERVRENLGVFGWELEEDEVAGKGGLATEEYSPCAWDPSVDCQD